MATITNDTQPEGPRLFSLSVSDWRQFAQVNIDLHPHLTVLTGVNGSGKSTLLHILAKHFNWQTMFVSVPARIQSGIPRYVPDYQDPYFPDSESQDPLAFIDPPPSGESSWTGKTPPGVREGISRQYLHSPGKQQDLRRIGAIAYEGSPTLQLGVPEESQQAVYDILPITQSGQQLPNRQVVQVVRTQQGQVQQVVGQSAWPQVSGIYISPFRTPTFFTQIVTIPSQFVAARQILEVFVQEQRNRYYNVWTGQPNRSPFMALKESLIAAAVYGSGNEFVLQNEEARDIWIGFQSTLHRILPPELGFRRLLVEAPDILIEDKKGRRYSIDSASGGVSSIMELAWQIFLCSWQRQHFTVVIDEPENHLHPTLQRSLFPGLVAGFPNAQFIVATHSAFVVTSVAQSNVYVLRHGDDGYVRSQLLDTVNKAANADKTLRDVLGLESTIPMWAESRYLEVMRRYLAISEPSAEDLQLLRTDLEGLGLADEFPRSVREIVNEHGDDYRRPESGHAET